MQGDSFFFAFARARDAVSAAADAQRALAVHEWSEAPITVRMGLHTGEPDVTQAGLYAGLDVHRAARVMSVGHGGQILLSARTTDLVEEELPKGLSVRRIGAYLLKDFDRPEALTSSSSTACRRTSHRSGRRRRRPRPKSARAFAVGCGGLPAQRPLSSRSQRPSRSLPQRAATQSPADRLTMRWSRSIPPPTASSAGSGSARRRPGSRSATRPSGSERGRRDVDEARRFGTYDPHDRHGRNADGCHNDTGRRLGRRSSEPDSASTPRPAFRPSR